MESSILWITLNTMGAEEMAQQLKAVVDRAEDPGLDPSILVRWLTTLFSFPLLASEGTCTHVAHMYTLSHTHPYKINLKYYETIK